MTRRQNRLHTANRSQHLIKLWHVSQGPGGLPSFAILSATPELSHQRDRSRHAITASRAWKKKIPGFQSPRVGHHKSRVKKSVRPYAELVQASCHSYADKISKMGMHMRRRYKLETPTLETILWKFLAKGQLTSRDGKLDFFGVITGKNPPWWGSCASTSASISILSPSSANMRHCTTPLLARIHHKDIESRSVQLLEYHSIRD